MRVYNVLHKIWASAFVFVYMSLVAFTGARTLLSKQSFCFLFFPLFFFFFFFLGGGGKPLITNNACPPPQPLSPQSSVPAPLVALLVYVVLVCVFVSVWQNVVIHWVNSRSNFPWSFSFSVKLYQFTMNVVIPLAGVIMKSPGMEVNSTQSVLYISWPVTVVNCTPFRVIFYTEFCECMCICDTFFCRTFRNRTDSVKSGREISNRTESQRTKTLNIRRATAPDICDNYTYVCYLVGYPVGGCVRLIVWGGGGRKMFDCLSMYDAISVLLSVYYTGWPKNNGTAYFR